MLLLPGGAPEIPPTGVVVDIVTTDNLLTLPTDVESRHVFSGTSGLKTSPCSFADALSPCSPCAHTVPNLPYKTTDGMRGVIMDGGELGCVER